MEVDHRGIRVPPDFFDGFHIRPKGRMGFAVLEGAPSHRADENGDGIDIAGLVDISPQVLLVVSLGIGGTAPLARLVVMSELDKDVLGALAEDRFPTSLA